MVWSFTSDGKTASYTIGMVSEMSGTDGGGAIMPKKTGNGEETANKQPLKFNL
jgi:hypothetical protein